MQPRYAFYFADLLIIFLILTLNVVVFILVLRELTCGRNKNLGKSSDRDKKEAITRSIRAIAMCSILGLTWIFGFLSIVENSASSLTFQVLFCLFNSLQGLFIFLLFCVRQEEVRNAWKEWFTFGKFVKYGNFYSTSSHDGHSRGTDWANTCSTGVGNAVASNPSESFELISKSQNKTSSGQVKMLNGQEKTGKAPENVEPLPKSGDKITNGGWTAPQSAESVESPPDQPSNEQDAQYAKPQVFKLWIATQIGIESTFSLGHGPFYNANRKEEKGTEEGSRN